ncbi:MAG: hypothetical protein AUG44_00465 [Actinobacteria bacterium 13_1_20CM_3_71_11]|nr:MAG: hypothetical protein AUG44_00465 [Actinobacteria bacterium 13_1_20CM_3_71_11]
MKLTVLTAVTGLVLLLIIFELVRRRQLREKYAVLWGAVGIVVLPLGFFPRLLDTVSHLVGVVSGVSLVLFLGVVFLLLVCVHLSWEVSRLEEETRTLAEDLALLRTEVRNLPPADPAQVLAHEKSQVADDQR